MKGHPPKSLNQVLTSLPVILLHHLLEHPPSCFLDHLEIIPEFHQILTFLIVEYHLKYFILPKSARLVY